MTSSHSRVSAQAIDPGLQPCMVSTQANSAHRRAFASNFGKDAIIEPAKFADWAAPIIHFPIHFPIPSLTSAFLSAYIL